MRTLTLLTALLLLAIDPLHGRAEVVLDHKQLGKDDQDMYITFGGHEENEGSAIQVADELSSASCFCRTGGCVFPECQVGVCRPGNRIYRLCCRR